MHEIKLGGLDGGNLLGYLAALGTLRLLTLAEPEAEVRMSWREDGWWIPVVHHSRVATEEDLVALLAVKTVGESTIDPAWRISDDLTLDLSQFREHLRQQASAAGVDQRTTADYLAAFGSEAFGTGPKKGQMSDSEFRTMSGAGHQHLLGFMRELAVGTDGDHLKRTLFRAWDYADPRPSLRWDPVDYRPHALRAEDPSGDPIRTMRGANRLAIEALPLFPTVPGRRRVSTLAFACHDGKTAVTWPIWIEPFDLATVASILALEELQFADRSTMARRHIAQVFRAQRFTEGKYRNFSPSRALL